MKKVIAQPAILNQWEAGSTEIVVLEVKTPFFIACWKYIE